MAEKATILIPDISGFTEFTSLTAIDHAAHIITELLELIVESNKMNFTLAEIEGDAVLFYLKEEKPAVQALVDQCMSTFNNFHVRLMIIERDTVCQCGACQTASNLTLKFIIHFGEIKEIKVANFTKATGVDMIIAHRLLKNSINSDEYILVTKSCTDCSAEELPSDATNWSVLKQQYPAIGEVSYHYTTLSEFKARLPKPPKPPEYVIVKGPDNLEVEISRSLQEVYQMLINVDERKNWMIGVDQINRDPVTERIGMMHNCQFMGMTMENTCFHADYGEEAATYVERVVVDQMSLDTIDIYNLEAINEQSTRLRFNINWKDTPLPDESKNQILVGIKANLESLKQFLET